MSADLAKDAAALLQQILQQTADARGADNHRECFELIDQLLGKLCEANAARYVFVMQDPSPQTQMFYVSSGTQDRPQSTVELLQVALRCMQLEDESLSASDDQSHWKH